MKIAIKRFLTQIDKRLVNSKIGPKKVLYFFVMPGFQEYTKNLIVMANAFLGTEYQPVFIVCYEAIDHCIWGLDKKDLKERKAICTSCSWLTLKHLKETNYPVIYLKDYVSKMTEIEKEKLEKVKISQMIYDGIDFLLWLQEE